MTCGIGSCSFQEVAQPVLRPLPINEVRYFAAPVTRGVRKWGWGCYWQDARIAAEGTITKFGLMPLPTYPVNNKDMLSLPSKEGESQVLSKHVDWRTPK